MPLRFGALRSRAGFKAPLTKCPEHYALLTASVNGSRTKSFPQVKKNLIFILYAPGMEDDEMTASLEHLYLEQASKVVAELQKIIEAYLELEYQLYLQAHFDLRVDFPYGQEEES